jgi:PAS domain-containing protein
MDWMNMSLAAIVALTSLATAALALLVLARFLPTRRISWAPFDSLGDQTAFLFHDDKLIDATPEARALFLQGPEHLEDWPRLAVVLGTRFPDLLDQLGDLGSRLRVELKACTGDVDLVAEWRSGLTRVTLATADAVERGRTFPNALPRPSDDLAGRTLAEEVSVLRGLLDGAPVVIWKEDAGGAVRWANTAYVELALRIDADSGTLTWPLPSLFDDVPAEIGTDTDEAGEAPRISLKVPGAEPGDPDTTLWFEIHGRMTATGRILYALPADRLRKTEANLREFVQTLTKTFAHLPIGLAVFDRDRRLVVFNPALTDLTSLEPLFLSRRPTLFEFLDQLREAQRMPEPKDYRDWRRRIGELEAAAISGPHIETWTLPDGQTFRVTGRPHPEGAVAFLFQDITSEKSLTRRFRSELEIGQSVIDSLDEAVAVFSASQSLVMTNAAYDTLWGETSADALTTISVREAATRWQEACQPTPVWLDVRNFAGRSASDPPVAGTVRLHDGRALSVRAVPLARGATLVGFRVQESGTTRLSPAPEPDAIVAVPAAEPARPVPIASPAEPRHVSS